MKPISDDEFKELLKLKQQSKDENTVIFGFLGLFWWALIIGLGIFVVLGIAGLLVFGIKQIF